MTSAELWAAAEDAWHAAADEACLVVRLAAERARIGADVAERLARLERLEGTLARALEATISERQEVMRLLDLEERLARLSARIDRNAVRRAIGHQEAA